MPMTRQEIYQQLTPIFREVLEDDAIELHDALTANDVADWDSQNHTTLILAAEMHFGVKFRTAELDGMKNVGDFVTAIEKKVNAPAKA
jgi:acyl carrier protein